jgi:hypothetical protein
MDLNDVGMRVKRRDQLSRGLAKGIVAWKLCNDPLL